MPTRTADPHPPIPAKREFRGTERFWHFAHSEHHGAFDMVSDFEIEPQNGQLSSDVWKLAWSSLSRSFPVLSQRVQQFDGQGSAMSGGVRAEDQVFFAPNCKTDQERIDFCLDRRQFDAVALTVFDASQAGGDSIHLAITNPHSLGDAKGIFQIVKELVRAIRHSEDALVAPEHLEGGYASHGSETGNLADLGLDEMFQVAKKGSTTGFKVLPRPASSLTRSNGEEWRRTCLFSQFETDSLITFCKSKSLTVSAWLQASIYHSMLDVLGGESSDWPTKHTFTVPAMPFHNRSYASGATSTVCAPVSVDIGHGATVEETASAVTNSFALARRFGVDVQDEYVKILLKLFTAARPETCIPTLSSLGRLDSFNGLRSYHVAARNNLPSMGIHAWTLDGRLSVSLSWAPTRFDQDQINSFWSTWINAIRSAQKRCDL